MTFSSMSDLRLLALFGASAAVALAIQNFFVTTSLVEAGQVVSSNAIEEKHQDLCLTCLSSRERISGVQYHQKWEKRVQLRLKDREIRLRMLDHEGERRAVVQAKLREQVEALEAEAARRGIIVQLQLPTPTTNPKLISKKKSALVSRSCPHRNSLRIVGTTTFCS
ncbi:hypothetical protein BJ742DRAFT_733968 [Cladochytrium replicatum]|nr:hypothetical protein BJ742DRAFT_733968 [Cladochytrium replicatum]